MRKYYNLYAIIVLTAIVGCTRDAVKPADRNSTEKKVIVTTVAGGDSLSGFLDGPALSSKFAYPSDVAVAPDGTIYVTDLFNGRIRKISTGQVSTFAGNTNTGGIANGHGQSALFIYPNRVVMDSSGNLYSLDGIDSRVRKITPAADVSTYAGIATPGFKDGKADIASFQGGSAGIVADAVGNIYVADTYNHSIRKISLSGTVSTIAGNGFAGFREGSGEDAQFNAPGGMAIDQQGNLFVVDRGNYRIRKIGAGGKTSTLAGTGAQGFMDGRAGIAQFDVVNDMVIDRQGNLYVSDDHRIRKISSQGDVSTIAGSFAGYIDDEGAWAKFYYPIGLGIDSQGNIYVADSFNQRIRKISFE